MIISLFCLHRFPSLGLSLRGSKSSLLLRAYPVAGVFISPLDSWASVQTGRFSRYIIACWSLPSLCCTFRQLWPTCGSPWSRLLVAHSFCSLSCFQSCSRLFLQSAVASVTAGGCLETRIQGRLCSVCSCGTAALSAGLVHGARGSVSKTSRVHTDVFKTNLKLYSFT